MSLSKKQIKFLRAKCHDLKAVIMLGQKGLTEEVLNELNIALDYHELVKIKLAVDDREARKQLIADICKKTQSEEIQSIGKTLSVYRMNIEKPVIELPSGK
jgi:RNA-binding protein